MHHVYKRNLLNEYPNAILIKESAFSKTNVLAHYVNNMTVPENSIILFGLKYNTSNKAPVKLIKEYLKNLLPDLATVKAETVLCADAAYFKVLTGMRKAEPHHGYVKPCVIPGYENLNIILVLNYQALFHNPASKDKIVLSLTTFNNHVIGTHTDIGVNVIHNGYYPHAYHDIVDAIQDLHQYPELSCDIETFSLKFWKAGIGSIGFAWDENNGIAFSCDYLEVNPDQLINSDVGRIYGVFEKNISVRKQLLLFFLTYKGKITYHNGTFDIKVLIFTLFMENLLDYEGMIKGLDVMTKNIDDSKLIAYLATNTTAGNDLKLKSLAFAHAGNYAQDDIDDIRLIPRDELLRYNLVDAVCTNWVKNKYYPIMVQDQQLDLYNDMFIPGTRMIVHTELTGMPMDMGRVHDTEKKLTAALEKQYAILRVSGTVKAYEWEAQRIAMIDANLLLKKKIRPIESFKETFNPNSGPQTAALLHDYLGFEITDTTNTGLPATGGKILKKHLAKLMKENNLTDEDLK